MSKRVHSQPKREPKHSAAGERPTPKRRGMHAPIVQSFFRMRKAVGVMGVALPISVYALHWLLLSWRMREPVAPASALRDSVSAYYHADGQVRAVFVGTLFAVAVFLFAYPGSERRANERISEGTLATIAAVFALGVALLPVAPGEEDIGWVHVAHLGSAVAFFLCLIAFSWVKFPQERVAGGPTNTTGTTPKSKDQLGRLRTYVGCALAMTTSLLAMVVYSVFESMGIVDWDNWGFVFWCELIALVAFGISWLTSGGALEGKSLGSVRYVPSDELLLGWTARLHGEAAPQDVRGFIEALPSAPDPIELSTADLEPA